GLLVQAPIARAQDVARVVGDHVRDAGTRTDLPCVLAVDVENLVVPPHEVDAHAHVRRYPRVRPPRILHVEGDVAIAGRQGQPVGGRAVLLMEPHQTGGGIV